MERFLWFCCNFSSMDELKGRHFDKSVIFFLEKLPQVHHAVSEII